MNFKRRPSDTPELLLVPLIDIVLVLLIFMAMTATFSRYSQLQVQLPQAQGQPNVTPPRSLWIQINAQGQIKLEQENLGRLSSAQLARQLQPWASTPENPTTVVIGADARTPHQSVVSVMEAARMAGLAKITFMSNGPGRQP